MRALSAELLTDLATIQRLTPTDDGALGVALTPATLATGVPADLRPSRRPPVERDQAGRLTELQEWSIRLPAGQDVTAADRILIGGRTFEVTGVPTRASREITRRVVAVEIT